MMPFCGYFIKWLLITVLFVVSSLICGEQYEIYGSIFRELDKQEIITPWIQKDLQSIRLEFQKQLVPSLGLSLSLSLYWVHMHCTVSLFCLCGKKKQYKLSLY